MASIGIPFVTFSVLTSYQFVIAASYWSGRCIAWTVDNHVIKSNPEVDRRPFTQPNTMI